VLRGNTLCSVQLVASQFAVFHIYGPSSFVHIERPQIFCYRGPKISSTRPLFLYTDRLKTTELYWKLQFIPCSKLRFGYKNQNQLILYKDVIYFCSEIHIKQVNTLFICFSSFHSCTVHLDNIEVLFTKWCTIELL